MSFPDINARPAALEAWRNQKRKLGMSMGMATGLELAGISKSFGTNRVLDDISLSVAPGEVVSLVGPSGCGKSTLLRIIAGLEPQDAGVVRIGGSHVDHLGPRARNIAMVFQNYALYPHMSAFDNIALPLRISRLSLLERLSLLKLLSPRRARIERSIAEEVHAVAAQLQLGSLLARKPAELSGGQRQRVALGRAMVRNPTLFLMDEPLSNLDAQLRVHMRDELTELHQRLGATFVYVTHDQIEAMTMSTRVAMMDGGRLAQVGRPRELYDHPATLAVARFIGTPAINILPADVLASGQIEMFDVPLPLATNRPGGDSLSLGVRPEAFQLHRIPVDRSIPARVRRIEHHGADRHVFVDLQSPGRGTAIVRLAIGTQADEALLVGADIWLTFDARDAHVFDQHGQRIHITLINPLLPARAHPGIDRTVLCAS